MKASPFSNFSIFLLWLVHGAAGQDGVRWVNEGWEEEEDRERKAIEEDLDIERDAIEEDVDMEGEAIKEGVMLLFPRQLFASGRVLAEVAEEGGKLSFCSLSIV